MKKITFILFYFILLAEKSFCTSDSTARLRFDSAFHAIENVLEGKQALSFEEAVYLVENAYLGTIPHYWYVSQLDKIESDIFKYSQSVFFKSDSIEIKNPLSLKFNYALFQYFTDTISLPSGKLNYPYTYNTRDPFGEKDYSATFVSTLMNPNVKIGNCHSMAFLYKILAERLKAEAWLTVVPYHVFIQHRDHKGDLYNIDLTRGAFPQDGIIRAITHTSSESVVSGLYYRRLNDKENLTLCLVDLAKNYEKKFHILGDSFMLNCAELAIKHDSLNANARLLKIQVLRHYVMQGKSEYTIELKEEMMTLNKLGYRKPPEDHIVKLIRQLR